MYDKPKFIHKQFLNYFCCKEFIVSANRFISVFLPQVIGCHTKMVKVRKLNCRPLTKEYIGETVTPVSRISLSHAQNMKDKFVILI
jgi:hypothetical protein